jgi:hypothetical protein
MLNPNNAERLVKILGMLGSDHAGERDTAARMASRMLADLSLTWQMVIIAPAPSIVPASGAARRSNPDTDYRQMARFCWNHRWGLSGRDQEFVRSMLNWSGDPSEAQQRWLCSLYSRVWRMSRGRV